MDDRNSKDSTVARDDEPVSKPRRSRRSRNSRSRKPVSSSASSSANGSSSPAAVAPTSALNDPTWYKRYPLLAETAAKFQFMNRPGEFIIPGTTGKTSALKEFPGIMRIEWEPALGSSSDNSSPASICAKGIWDKIRDAYSGSLAVDPPDIFFYMMHLCQFNAYIAWLKRLYGVINMYTPFNTYAPKVLFSAMFPADAGIISDETFFKWMAAKNDLVWWINELVAMINGYVIPNNMSVFDRQRWMCENVYRDASTVLSQLYVFAPVGFFKVNGVATPHGTKCEFIRLSSGEGRRDVRNPEEAFAYGVDMFRALADWGDARTINGYLMRAFKDNLMPPVAELNSAYIVEPVYEPEVCLQIHNIRVWSTYREHEWTQDPATGAVLVAPNPDALTNNLDSPVLDIPVDIPSEDAVIVASRLCPVCESTKNIDGTVVYASRVGTEVVTGLFITIRFDSTVSVSNSTWLNLNFRMVNALSKENQRRDYLSHRLLALSQYVAFNDAPIMPFSYSEADTGSSDANAFNTYIGNLTNMSVIPTRTMARLHLVCQQSEFNIFRPRFA